MQINSNYGFCYSTRQKCDVWTGPNTKLYKPGPYKRDFTVLAKTIYTFWYHSGLVQENHLTLWNRKNTCWRLTPVLAGLVLTPSFLCITSNCVLLLVPVRLTNLITIFLWTVARQSSGRVCYKYEIKICCSTSSSNSRKGILINLPNSLPFFF